MTFTLNILINLCLIFALWRVSKKNVHKEIRIKYLNHPKVIGKLDKMYISCKLAEKMADRAFNMASTANLGVIALQKALAVPRIVTPRQATQNKLAKKEVESLFSQNGTFDYLRPILSDEELDLIDEAQKHLEKHNGKKDS